MAPPVTDSRTQANLAEAGFITDARTVVSQVRRSLGRFIASLDEPIRRPTDLQKTLGIDKALGWQTFHAWTAGELLESAPFIPRPAPLRRILKVGRKLGVPDTVIEELEQSCTRFEEFVGEHAGDRDTFDAMVEGLLDDSRQNTLPDRRAAYRAQSRLWGVLAQARMDSVIFAPFEHGDMGEMALVTGFVGLQQLRRNATFRMSSRVRCTTQASLNATPVFDNPPPPPPQDQDRRHNGVNELIEPFCSSPLPVFTTYELGDNLLETTVEFADIGRPAAVTYFLRRILQYPQDAPDDSFQINAVSSTPVQVLYTHLFVPAGLSDPATGSAATYGHLQAVERAWHETYSNRLPVTARVTHLGRSLDSLHTADFPPFADMIRSVLDGLRWGDREYDIYRCRVEYPILHACVHAGVKARPAAGSG